MWPKNNKNLADITCALFVDSIDSNTNSLYEGKKLNQLLRAVIIIIAKAINPEILYVKSYAVSPTSLYLLIKYFNGIILNDDDTIETTLTSSNITHEKATQYIKENGGKMIYIDLNNFKESYTLLYHNSCTLYIPYQTHKIL